MTYESLCRKMNYDPLKDVLPESGAECYDVETPFSVLTLEELDFLEDYIFNHKAS